MMRLLVALVLCLPTIGSAATVCVNTAGTGGCFPTIQQGVDAAVAGDTVDVAAGTYVEHVVVPKNKRIRLQGAGPAATLIDGNGVRTVLKLKGPNRNITVTGIGIQNGGRGLAFGPGVKISISDCAITGNVGGGGISGDGTGSSVTVTRCTITGNSSTASGGGIGIAPSGSRSTPRSRLKVVSSTIRRNSTAVRGGGISVYAGNVKLVASWIDDNSAFFSGGGIAGHDVVVVDSTISRNTSLGGDGAREGGGGIFAGNLTARNSTISGNSATRGGPGSSNSLGGGVLAGNIRLEHATVASNASENEGGGIYADGVKLSASLIADNSAPSGSDCKSGQGRSFGANLIEDSTSCEVSTSGKSVVITADPMLGPLQNNGGATETHALLAGSPAIGVVTTTALCKAPDQRGQTRAVPCDLGSYEAP